MLKFTQNYKESGSDLDSFLTLLEEVDKATKIEVINTSSIRFAYIINNETDCKEIALFNLSKEELNKVASRFASFVVDNKRDGFQTLLCMEADSVFQLKRSKISVDKELFKELCSASKTLMIYDGSSKIVSPIAVTTILNRANLGGEMLNIPSVGRTTEVFKSFQRANKEVTIVSRGDVIMGVHSDTYKYIPHLTLKSIKEKFEEKLGDCQCDYWYFDNSTTKMYINFKKYQEDIAATYSLPQNITPGIVVTTSDTGDSSFIISAYWQIKNHIFRCDTGIKRRHQGEFDVDKLIDEAADMLFKKYSVLPERLCELLKIEVPKSQMKEVINKVLEYTKIGKSNALGRSNKEQLVSQLTVELASDNHTAYDVAMAIAESASRIKGIPEYKRSTIEECLNRAFFADYNIKPITLTM